MALTFATPEDYEAHLLALRPTGPAWPESDDIISAAAAEFARAHSRAVQVVEEVDPRTTVELLPDWEKTAGLPDLCGAAAQTIQERRNALVARLTARGGQSRAFFTALAADLGFAVSITEFRPFRAGQSTAGDPLTNGDWIFVWRINAPQTTVTSFRAGQSAAGEPIRKWGNEALECVMNRRKPAHTRLLFGYGAANYVDEDYIDSGYFD